MKKLFAVHSHPLSLWERVKVRAIVGDRRRVLPGGPVLAFAGRPLTPALSQRERQKSVNRMATSVLTSVCLLTALSRCAIAQHPDVSPRVAGGQIVTDGYNDNDDSITPDVRVFNFVFGEDHPDQPFYTGDPGFHAVPGSGFATGNNLRFNILSGLPVGLPAALTYWDGNGTPSFGLAPNSETLTLKGGALTAVAGSGNAEVPGFVIGTFLDENPPLHVHLSSFLNGPGVDPTDGIYLISLGLSTDSPGVGAADPLFILYDSGLSETKLQAAIGFVHTTLVPEPSSIVLAALGCAAVAALVRRRH